MSKPSHLFHLFVDKKFHRQGVGRFMWRYIVDNSQEKQFTVSSSTFAVAFYQKIGFVTTAEAQEKNGIISVPMSFTR